MQYDAYTGCDAKHVSIGTPVTIPDEEVRAACPRKPHQPANRTAVPHTLRALQEGRKKPVYVQDQVATDEQGRRRFHGAFTGGFSAGYYNTVGECRAAVPQPVLRRAGPHAACAAGSEKGWTPSTFKSSRGQKCPSAASDPARRGPTLSQAGTAAEGGGLHG